jgi:hypothetical protein
MSQRYVQHPWFTDVINTMDATLTNSTNTQYAPPSGSGGMVEIRGCARLKSGASSGHAAPFYLVQGWSNIAGTVTMEGSATNVVAISSGNAALSTAVISVAIVAGKVTPKVTGIASTNIEWLLDVRYTVN